jgi:hypothetical protein
MKRRLLNFKLTDDTEWIGTVVDAQGEGQRAEFMRRMIEDGLKSNGIYKKDVLSGQVRVLQVLPVLPTVLPSKTEVVKPCDHVEKINIPILEEIVDEQEELRGLKNKLKNMRF